MKKIKEYVSQVKENVVDFYHEHDEAIEMAGFVGLNMAYLGWVGGMVLMNKIDREAVKSVLEENPELKKLWVETLVKNQMKNL